MSNIYQGYRESSSQKALKEAIGSYDEPEPKMTKMPTPMPDLTEKGFPVSIEVARATTQEIHELLGRIAHITTIPVEDLIQLQSVEKADNPYELIKKIIDLRRLLDKQLEEVFQDYHTVQFYRNQQSNTGEVEPSSEH